MTTPLTRLLLALNLAWLGASPAPAQAADAAPPTLAPAVKAAAAFDSGMLHIQKFGTGPRALILIPGLGCGPWSWSGTIDEFAKDHAIYAITLPGFDGRPASAEKPLFEAFAKDFWKFLDAEKLAAKPVVIGHSLGGTLAIVLAAQRPERLAGIVAVDGLPVFPALAAATPQQRQAFASQAAQRFAAFDAAETLAYQENFMSSSGTMKPEFVKPAAKRLAASDPKAVAAWMQEILEGDRRAELSKITIPLLEIMPYNPADAKPPMAYTQAQTLAFYQSLLAGAPHATVVAIEPSRHFPMLDQSEAFHKILAQFLASLR